MKGSYKQKPKHGLVLNPWKFYLMFLSREIDIKLCQIFTKIHKYTILYKSSRFKQIIFSKYANNLKTTISQRSLIVTGFLLLFLFLLLIDIIDKIILKSVSHDQNSHQWRCSILTGHVIQKGTGDQYTALPLVGVLVMWYGF